MIFNGFELSGDRSPFKSIIDHLIFIYDLHGRGDSFKFLNSASFFKKLNMNCFHNSLTAQNQDTINEISVNEVPGGGNYLM